MSLLKAVFLSSLTFIMYKFIGIKKLTKLNIIDIIIIFLISFQFIEVIYFNKSFTLSFINILIFIILEFFLWVTNQRKNSSKVLVYKKRKFYILNCFKYNVTIFDFIKLLKENNMDNFKNIKEIYTINNHLYISNQEKNDNTVFLITDGIINYDNLYSINKDKNWLYKNIDCPINNIICGFYKDNNLYFIKSSVI